MLMHYKMRICLGLNTMEILDIVRFPLTELYGTNNRKHKMI